MSSAATWAQRRSRHPIAAAVGRFLHLMAADPGNPPALEALIRLLDELAWLAHQIRREEIEHGDVAVETEPPDADWAASSRQAFAWVGHVRSEAREGRPQIDCPAVELSEIVDDLARIQWRFRSTSDGDALFHYQLGFISHWGHHLRRVQQALHAWYW
ncbi:hypothetical protein G3480_26280 [Thiorhodococcus mannitoliphagus]|uniref:DUF5063 domain-containing protein n=1 Tax=Thiorhodococcus mannitoliphagus TaxID=329406 RepID=A0A6P1E3S3_9GAMM|nr:hypothetical protein [Thiorhodococcus mannitoliphagus]NEX23733.1 hypothetical protein [Thiorhodococcus mannitoliphagus]